MKNPNAHIYFSDFFNVSILCYLTLGWSKIANERLLIDMKRGKCHPAINHDRRMASFFSTLHFQKSFRFRLSGIFELYHILRWAITSKQFYDDFAGWPKLDPECLIPYKGKNIFTWHLAFSVDMNYINKCHYTIERGISAADHNSGSSGLQPWRNTWFQDLLIEENIFIKRGNLAICGALEYAWGKHLSEFMVLEQTKLSRRSAPFPFAIFPDV